MKLYAEVPYHRTRQIASDVAVAVWIFVWIRIGFWMHDLVAKLAGPGKTVQDAGNGFARNLESIGDRVGDIPLVGDRLTAPFDAAAGAGRTLEQAGATQQDVIHTLALWLGVLLAVIPIGYVLLRQVPKRVRWIREASAASRLRIDAEDLQLFAIRAVSTRPLYELRRACDDPAKALVSGDYLPLAGIELGALGLHVGPRNEVVSE